MSVQRARGTAAETAVVRYLQANGHVTVERRALGGVHDRGDISGLSETVVEVKAHRAMDLASWVDQSRKAMRPGDRIAAVWHKRRGKGSPGDWYVTMTGDDFIRLLERRA